MIFIYHDFGGTHTTSMAAAYHLKKLPGNRRLRKDEVLNIKYFNKLTKHDAGKLIFHGKDDKNNLVYTLGRRKNKYVSKSLEELATLLQQEFNLEEKVIISNTSPTVPIIMTIGGFLAKGINMNSLGTPLLVFGAKQCCFQIKDLVLYTKKMSRSIDKGVVVLNNKQFK